MMWFILYRDLFYLRVCIDLGAVVFRISHHSAYIASTAHQDSMLCPMLVKICPSLGVFSLKLFVKKEHSYLNKGFIICFYLLKGKF